MSLLAICNPSLDRRKFSSAPKLSNGLGAARADLQRDKAYLVVPVENGYPLAANVEVVPAVQLATLLQTIE